MDDDLWAWAAAAEGIRHSSSEIDFRRFLQEASTNDVVIANQFEENQCNDKGINPIYYGDVEILDFGGEFRYDHAPITTSMAEPPHRSDAPMNPEEFQAYLKSRLHLECRAVASIREKSTCEVLPVAPAPTLLQLSPNDGGSQQDSSSAAAGAHEEGDSISHNVLACNSSTSKKSMKTTTTTTSESSGGQSEEEDEEKADTIDDHNSHTAGNDKKMRRKLLNRESARRSRRRKHEEKTDLEAHVAQLGEDKSKLLEQLTDIIQKSNQEAADNKILRSQVDHLRAQVRLLEGKVAKLPFMRSSSAINNPPPRPPQARALHQDNWTTHQTNSNHKDTISLSPPDSELK